MRKLYVLPFDHRGSFAKMFGLRHGSLTVEDTACLADYKHVVYEGFLAALDLGISKDDAAILVDEELGAKIHEEARKAGITRILTIEKSGQDEFDFEYGEDFGAHIEKLKPDYVKVLVRYNPQGDKDINKRQTARLKTLNDFCTKAGYKFLFELLAVPADDQLAEAVGKEEFENSFQWKVMRDSIVELKAAGIEPDVWKLEGLENQGQFEGVIQEAQRGLDKEVGVIVLGRGEGGARVRKWLEVAAKIPDVIGMAVGRTVFKQPLLDFAAKKISREEAASRIAKNYKGFVDLFESARRGGRTQKQS